MAFPTQSLPAPRPLIGAALMLGAMASLPFIDVIAKYLGQQNIPIVEIVWARLTFGALITWPFAWRLKGAAGLVPQNLHYHLWRASFLIAATFSYFWSLKYLSIADALAIFFVQPLIVTVLSALILKERVGPHRWAAVFVGFIGTLIIIRPGSGVLNPGSFLALASGAFLAAYFVMTRKISGQAPAMLTTFHTSAIGCVLVSCAVPFYWHWPTQDQWAIFAALGIVATFGHYLIVRAYDHAEASMLAPLAYTEMIVATWLGWYFFGDFPDAYTLLGVAILIGCALYISIRERAQG